MKIGFGILVTVICILNTGLLMAGCLNGNCTDGNGTYVYKNGVKYSGSFYRGLPHGNGQLYYPDGSQYSGNFVKGKKQGYGILRYKEGNIYKGDFSNDLISGYGVMEYANGDSYSGNWTDNTMHGTGTYYARDGWIFHGNFKAGKPDGRADMTLADGTVYSGTWVKGWKQGVFNIKKSSGETVRVIFKDDEYVGPENVLADKKQEIRTQSEAPPSKVKNCNSFRCHDETGYMIMQDGGIYYGSFMHGLPEGKGKAKLPDGSFIQGYWKSGKPVNVARLPAGHQMTDKTTGIPANCDASNNSQNSESQSKVVREAVPKSENTAPLIYAMIVGVSSYKALPSLKYTDDDAYRFYAFLKSPEGGAVNDDRIRLLIDDAASSSGILKNLDILIKNPGQEDALIVYLSGHGLDGAFVPYDFDGTGPLTPYEEVWKAIKKSKAKHKLVIADACHSGSLAYGVRSAASANIQKYYETLSATSGGTAILVSSAQDEVSLEYGGMRQGVFSHFLIRGLKGEGDLNKNGIVELGELYRYIAANVQGHTAGKQNPVLQGDYDVNMPMAVVR